MRALREAKNQKERKRERECTCVFERCCPWKCFDGKEKSALKGFFNFSLQCCLIQTTLMEESRLHLENSEYKRIPYILAWQAKKKFLTSFCCFSVYTGASQIPPFCIQNQNERSEEIEKTWYSSPTFLMVSCLDDN